MKEYNATLHGYKVVTPPRCKLERLEPTTAPITMQLHFAESAPVAMRVSKSLEYTGKDGNTYTWRNGGIELFALDGMLWKKYDSRGWHDDKWTIEELAGHCATHICNENYLERYPWQWRGDNEPPSGMLVRDRGTWCTIENLREQVLKGCDRYAVIDGELYEPANELVYTYDNTSEWRWYNHKEGVDRTGSVIVAKEYDTCDKFAHYLCNASQDWRKVNIYDEYADKISDKIFNNVSGVDFIEVLLPEYVTADPYGDFWRKEIESHKEKAENCNQAAKEHDEKARALREDAKKDRAAAKRELEAARKIAEKLECYLSAKEA